MKARRGSGYVTYWKHDRNAPSHGLRAIQRSLLTDKEILLAVAASPRNDRGAVEQYFRSIS